MAETSGLAKIENVPEHPIQMFNDVLAEGKTIQIVPYEVMCVASINAEKGVLNRNVILVKHDDDGFVFITERNTQKYKDYMKNPVVAATLVWILPKDDHVVFRQVRINGRIVELSDPEIAELYQSFPLHAKIRCKICKSGEPVDWNALKEEHDRVLMAYQNGTDPLEQNEHFTALRICPNDIDFYYSEQNLIADRILYTKQTNGTWASQHVAA